MEKNKPQKKVIEFKPGMRIDEYVKKILKIEQDKDRIKWLRTFDNCILPKHVKSAVDEAIVVVLQRKKFEEWDYMRILKKDLPILYWYTVLLVV